MTTLPNAKKDRFCTICAVAFTGEPRLFHDVLVSAGGVVRVWDSIAGHYTTCHALSEAEQEMLRDGREPYAEHTTLDD